MSNELIPAGIDQVRSYHLYVLFGGDVKRVAAVMRCDVEVIEALCHDFGWARKANAKQNLTTDEGQEYERALNRTQTYVTADMLGNVFGNVIAALNSDPEYARAFCTEVNDEGEKSYSTKNLVELAKGLEIVSNVKYRALGDKLAAAADVTSKEQSVTNVTLNVYRALANRFDAAIAVDAVSEIVRAVPSTAAATQTIKDSTAEAT